MNPLQPVIDLFSGFFPAFPPSFPDWAVKPAGRLFRLSEEHFPLLLIYNLLSCFPSQA